MKENLNKIDAYTTMKQMTSNITEKQTVETAF